ncbi:hypothetical protein [Mycoplasma suis]|uniref:Uncharacterized protein n=1 Tax=Mycoplasma suis (strain Illinois) TaxID=768700 RepID=F0QRI9_MYCSL|nr:hypothetical protein [Mycoplasma suis]ADX98109.1 hypothetical protein MSU_0577 [Mycoplasma suis str. Illinois]
MNEINSKREIISTETKEKTSSPENFQEAFKNLKENGENYLKSSEKGEVTVNSELTYFLKKEGRESLKSYFEKYLEVREKQEILTKEFGSSLGITSENGRSRRSAPIISTIEELKKTKESLEKIKWTAEGLDWAPLFNQYSEKSFESGENPFKQLLDNQEDWNNWISRVKGARQEKKEYMDSKRTCGVAFFWLSVNSICYPKLAEIERKIKRAESSMEVLIGRRMLRIMNQLQ